MWNQQQPNQSPFGGYGQTVDRAVFDEGLRKHMLRVYNFMMIGLAVTGLVAALVASTPALYVPIFTTPLKWVVMLAPLAFIMVLSWKFESMSVGALQGTFWAFCAVMGVSMASIFLVFTGASVARVFFITASMFAAMSLWGYTTKTDLSKMGAFLMMGLIGIVIASLVNILVGSTALQFAISVIGVLVFTGLTAYDTQRIKQEYAEHYGHDTNTKLAIMGALSLYLNFINLFQMLMQLMGQRDE
ncbi:Bax inhibitor-1/YccA family protein [Azospirillum doebereinerae]|uniref:Bax inhibitor-1/YccA family protein n=1 Tax=Azospirillum doebereinerae TaxID=92933 RepID=UPI001EE517A7|nr:Bax inhibitor-1/YccA family protein [Azospirillum doebereinerae]MCG5239906.1 Bax inhibitor-1/YccA family protein [Azospirillum doebereinerae]